MPNDKSLTKNGEEEQAKRAEDETIATSPIVPQVVPQEVLDKLPPEVKQQITLMMSHQRIGLPAPNPLAAKITSEHIGTILENSERDSKREFDSKWFSLAYVICALGFLVFVFLYLPTVDKELFVEVLKLLLTFLGGLGTGLGVSAYRKHSEK